MKAQIWNAAKVGVAISITNWIVGIILGIVGGVVGAAGTAAILTGNVEVLPAIGLGLIILLALIFGGLVLQGMLLPIILKWAKAKI